MLHLEHYAFWCSYVHSLYFTDRMLTKNKLIRDVLDVCLWFTRVPYSPTIPSIMLCILFLKRSKLVWAVTAVVVLVCDYKQKTWSMKYSWECMWQTVDVVLLWLQHYAKFVWHVLVLLSFCSMLGFINLCVTWDVLFLTHNVIALKDVVWCTW